ncbi:ABC transporter permease subunit [Devosia sp. J2-20]|jgi:oligopeptide transport system permease protein|uniref:Oligopeptide transport system permease protein OppC n=1 Tax=Devosia litorisediminis TaxID=2829817 RepID=A0A942E991_9HYPH|nr:MULTISPECIES: ABC transporter permease subunit [Devosia]MBS3847174.1 ABC transporter permease subunit [Devosia litorisediminis]MCZ4346547.1 ABC transporter permease subunit [Devosia neptuniae]WDQ99699.1 ABC transporter permease subunit [Devosia sp. J2-20]|tara:strand:- start:12985 stop:13905 length:921 start_codon:yes stop_codon:yes gene_type:complete
MAGITGKDEVLSQYAQKLETLDAPKGRSLTQDALRRLARNKAAVISIAIVIFIILAAFIGPHFVPWSYSEVDWTAIRKPPNFDKAHYFGTDQNGRDMLARVLQGTQMSLIVAAVATVVSVVIGIIYGAVAGYLGGRVDALMMRFVDVMYALPYILFVIILVVMFGRNPVLLFVGIGAIEWLTMARIVRGQTLSIKEREFVEAARAGGAKPWTIITRHIVPNLTGPVVIYATLTIPEIIIAESFLSYLGLGVQEPQTSLGTLISAGAPVAEVLPWMLLAPATVLVTLLLCLTYIGDGLRDALDPKDR